jgi:glycosyltransferase involved in cell wall biosynthesis
MDKNVNEIFVSVLLPAFNAEKHLRTAVESILSQTHRNFELLIINDGSGDQTEKIILSFADPRIRYIRNEKNIGLIASLNKGLEESKGEYIVRMDADDISLPARIEQQVAFMQKHIKTGAAGCWYYPIPFHIPNKVTGYTNPALLQTQLLFNSCLCHPATILRKKTLEENNIRYSPAHKHSEDYDFWIQLSKVSELNNVPEFLFKYRLHKNQVTSIHNSEQKKNARVVRAAYLKDLGFSFTEDELDTHNRISENSRIVSKEQLDRIEKWLLSLVKQNKNYNAISQEHFNFIMAKMWFDSCGNTSLGLFAYHKFFGSGLAAFFPLSSGLKFSLYAKCLFRRGMGL